MDSIPKNWQKYHLQFKKKKERGREQNKIDDEKNLLKYTIKRMYMANKGSLASNHNIMISNYTFFHNFTTAIIVVKLRWT